MTTIIFAGFRLSNSGIQPVTLERYYPGFAFDAGPSGALTWWSEEYKNAKEFRIIQLSYLRGFSYLYRQRNLTAPGIVTIRILRNGTSVAEHSIAHTFVTLGSVKGYLHLSQFDAVVFREGDLLSMQRFYTNYNGRMWRQTGIVEMERSNVRFFR